VVSDERKIRQILTNLLSNAVKFTESGSVTVACARTRGRELRIRVSDTGIGIPPEHIDRIFDPFWQVEQSATRRFRRHGSRPRRRAQARQAAGGQARGGEHRRCRAARSRCRCRAARPACRRGDGVTPALQPMTTEANAMLATEALSDLELLIKSRYGIIHIDTVEEERVQTLLRHVSDRLTTSVLHLVAHARPAGDGSETASTTRRIPHRLSPTSSSAQMAALYLFPRSTAWRPMSCSCSGCGSGG
jgi:hypothetical protein